MGARSAAEVRRSRTPGLQIAALDGALVACSAALNQGHPGATREFGVHRRQHNMPRGGARASASVFGGQGRARCGYVTAPGGSSSPRRTFSRRGLPMAAPRVSVSHLRRFTPLAQDPWPRSAKGSALATIDGSRRLKSASFTRPSVWQRAQRPAGARPGRFGADAGKRPARVGTHTLAWHPRPSLVMKGSPVRVRASALNESPANAGFLFALSPGRGWSGLRSCPLIPAECHGSWASGQPDPMRIVAGGTEHGCTGVGREGEEWRPMCPAVCSSRDRRHRGGQGCRWCRACGNRVGGFGATLVGPSCAIYPSPARATAGTTSTRLRESRFVDDHEGVDADLRQPTHLAGRVRRQPHADVTGERDDARARPHATGATLQRDRQRDRTGDLQL